MFTHRFSLWVAPLVAAAAFAFTPPEIMAKPHGGGGHHAAGHAPAHHAAVHYSAGHAPVHHSAYRAPAHAGAHYAGAYHRGVGAVGPYRGGYYNNRGYYGRGSYGRGYYGGGYYGGYGWAPWLGYGLGYPYAYNYGPYVNNYYDASPYSDAVPPDATYAAPSEPPFDAQAYSAPSNAPAELNVILPANGTVSFGDFQAAQAAGARQYETPALDAGNAYIYQMTAQWMDNGQPVTRTKTVRFHAGETVNVDFTNP